VPGAHHVLDPVLEDAEPVLKPVVGHGHVVGHQDLDSQPEGDLVALLPGVPQAHFKHRVG
jgi:hypothetical protein